MYLRKHIISTLTTGGAYIGYTDEVTGLLHAIFYEVSTAAPISDTAIATITGELTGRNIHAGVAIGAASKTVYPRSTDYMNTTGGVIASSSALTGYDKIPLVDERIKLSIPDSSAANQVGKFHFYVEGG